MKVFTMVCTVMFFVGGIIWSRKQWLDLFIKCALLAMAIWALVLAGMQLGFIVQR